MGPGSEPDADSSVAPGWLESVRTVVGARALAIDAWRAILTSWWLALVVLAVLQQAHAGLEERRELPVLLHILRDGALAVPAAALAVGIATLFIAPSAVRLDARPSGGARLAWAVAAAGIFALLTIPGSRLHGLLFGAEHGGMSWAADAAYDSSIAFIGALIALMPLAIVSGPPLERRRLASRPPVGGLDLVASHSADLTTGSTM